MSSSPPPKRRFLPEPVETTTKSSRRFAPEPVETTTKSSRRFAPEPVETTTKSSRKFPVEPVETTTKSSRKFVPEPVETTVKSSRKPAPEPVETTVKSSRKFVPEPVETTARSSRKFAPEPVETTVRSSKNKPEPAGDAAPRRRFAPQPVETTTRSNRDGRSDGVNGAEGQSRDASLSDAQPPPQIDAPPQTEPRPRRRFAPQLIETAKRTRKAGDVGPAVNQADRTEAIPEEGTRSPSRRLRPPATPVPPTNSPNNSVAPVPHLLEARRMGIPLRSDSISSNRSHSFRVPDLDTIESSESEEEEGTPSLSTSPSASSDQSSAYNHATRMRESIDERFSGFLLEIAAKAAEKQMREQAMAAFPNDDHHEPVDHFIAHDEDEEMGVEGADGVGEERRESFTKINWELLAMQRYTEEQAAKKEEVEKPSKPSKAAEPTKKNLWGEPQWGGPSTKSPWTNAAANSPWGNPAADLFANQRGRADEKELQGMQRGARPPMLGGDIKFPRCPSPEPARFDVTQGSEALRNSMCYLTEQTQEKEPQGLWCHGKKEEPAKEQPTAVGGRSKAPSLWSCPGSRPPSRGGLWNGCCLYTGSGDGNKQTGMLTPRIEVDNPFDSPPPTPARAPPSPPPSNPDMASIDDKLAAQQAMEEEFNDAFITQVYNYLSLGYPSLARKFDDELSKISRIPVEELRQDDELASARGYIRLGEDNNAKDAGITEETCMRWRALRVYIHEWAKQQPRMVPAGHALGGFGVAARRGSWAW